MSLDKNEIALEKFSQALAIKQKVKDEKDIAKIYSNLGLIYQEGKKYEMALDYFNLSLKLDESMKDRRGITASLVNLDAVYLDLKEYDKSLGFLQRVLALAQEIDMKISIKETYGYLSN